MYFSAYIQQQPQPNGRIVGVFLTHFFFSPPRAGDDPFRLWVFGTTAVTFTAYWLCGSLYTYADLTGRPAFLRRYKVQPGTNPAAEVRQRLWPAVIGQVLFNQIAVGLPFAAGAYWLMSRRTDGLAPIRQLPGAVAVLRDIALCVGVEEAGFYYTHRLLHRPWFFRHVHRQHHEWMSPVAVTAVYCHPLEHLLSNVLPPFVGVLLCRSHITTAWLWFCMAILNTLNAHSGYHLPFLPSPESHDFHHMK